MRNRCIKIVMLPAMLLLITACEGFLDVDVPKDRMVAETVFESDETAFAALSGIYIDLYNGVGFASGSLQSTMLLAGLSSDELDDYSGSLNYNPLYTNELLSENPMTLGLWGSCYRTIYAANSILNGITNSDALTVETKKMLEGEAKFVRAFAHFYLVNCFGNVPYVRTTDWRVNNKASRTSVEEVYALMINDLLRAKELLVDEYPSQGRLRPNKLAATALLARVYLYQGSWVNAEAQATIVINNSQYKLEDNLNNVFLTASSEAIWQLMHPHYGVSTNEASLLKLISSPAPGAQSFALSDTIVNSFEAGDLRKTNWVRVIGSSPAYYYPYKYKKRHEQATEAPEYSMVLRLAEQFLIRAEARAHQAGKLSLAVTDINVIRDRADLSPLSGAAVDTQAEVELAIEQERKVELFTEWGHRWFDLKRTNRADAVLGGIKSTWNSYDALYPIPEREIQKNHNLEPQNDGY